MELNWEKISKVTSSIQAIAVSFAAIIGGIWAIYTFDREGKLVSGCDISLSASQIKSPSDNGLYLSVDVDIK